MIDTTLAAFENDEWLVFAFVFTWPSYLQRLENGDCDE